jgi:hypothetical protein
MSVKLPTNFAKAIVASPPSGTGGLSFSVAAGKGALFPSPGVGEYFYGCFTNAARSAYEIVKIESRSTDSFTIDAAGRGADGTSAATWSTSDIFFLPTTRAMWDDIGVFGAAAQALADVTPAADRVPYFTSASAATVAPFTATGRSIVAAASASAALALLIPAGTKMMFQQTSAPTGWTKDTTHNDKALRIVSGTVSSGGATAFTSVFGSGKSTASYTLTTADIPSHSHAVTDPGHVHSGAWSAFQNNTAGGVPPLSGGNNVDTGSAGTGISIQNTGGGGGHSHSLSLDLQYVDVIVATKD